MSEEMVDVTYMDGDRRPMERMPISEIRFPLTIGEPPKSPLSLENERLAKWNRCLGGWLVVVSTMLLVLSVLRLIGA